MFSPPRPLDQLHYRPVLLNLTLKEMMMCGIFSLKTNILHGMQEYYSQAGAGCSIYSLQT